MKWFKKKKKTIDRIADSLEKIAEKLDKKEDKKAVAKPDVSNVLSNLNYYGNGDEISKDTAETPSIFGKNFDSKTKELKLDKGLYDRLASFSNDTLPKNFVPLFGKDEKFQPFIKPAEKRVDLKPEDIKLEESLDFDITEQEDSYLVVVETKFKPDTFIYFLNGEFKLRNAEREAKIDLKDLKDVDFDNFINDEKYNNGTFEFKIYKKKN